MRERGLERLASPLLDCVQVSSAVCVSHSRPASLWSGLAASPFAAVPPAAKRRLCPSGGGRGGRQPVRFVKRWRGCAQDPYANYVLQSALSVSAGPLHLGRVYLTLP